MVNPGSLGLGSGVRGGGFSVVVVYDGVATGPLTSHRVEVEGDITVLYLATLRLTKEHTRVGTTNRANTVKLGSVADVRNGDGGGAGLENLVEETAFGDENVIDLVVVRVHVHQPFGFRGTRVVLSFVVTILSDDVGRTQVF